MELWLLLGILSYLSYAMSTSIDKCMMDRSYGVFRTNTIKSLFDGLILLGVGLLFFKLGISSKLIIFSLVLGLLYAGTGILYFKILELKDVGQMVPYYQSLQIFMIFILSIIIFHDAASPFSYAGIALILIGVYIVLSDNGFKLPKISKAIFFGFLMVCINVIYYLLVKHFLSYVPAMDLAIAQYFAGTVFMVILTAFFFRKSLSSIFQVRSDIFMIAIAAVFGSLGTMLLFMALKIGVASKIYAIAGLQAVFVFIIASFLLKEKFMWHRLIGVVVVFAGIFFISL